MISML